MKTKPDCVYKKSTKGWDELKMRGAGLDAAARSAIILINGEDSLTAVERNLGRDILPPLEVLRGLGLVERLETSKPARAAAASPPRSSPNHLRLLARKLSRLRCRMPMTRPCAGKPFAARPWFASLRLLAPT